MIYAEIPTHAIKVRQKTKGMGDNEISFPNIPVNPQMNTIRYSRPVALLRVMVVFYIHYATRNNVFHDIHCILIDGFDISSGNNQ